MQSFMKSDVYETSILDDQEMIISVLRKTFTRGKPKTVFVVAIEILIKIPLIKH